MKIWFGIAVMSVMLLACNTDDLKTAYLEVRLTDAPGDYEEVNVDIQGVEVHASEGNDESGWRSLDVQKGVYDLLKLTNGLDTLLGTGEFPAGRISQVRLLLGENNSVRVGGEELDLDTPSGQQSGLKLNVQADLVEGIKYVILLDFDAAQSVLKTGNNKYKLKPVIRTIVNSESGAIKGTIDPVEASPAVFAIIGNDTLATANASETGKFLLRGLPSGSYTVSFEPKAGYVPVQKSDVSVSIGAVTDLGQINILQ